jgi:hypothetical protein
LGEAVTFALVASFFTATSSVCQRLGARQTETGGRFSLKLIVDLLGQPLWLAGVGSMILGFVFQLVALDVGSLALVQPILATELLFDAPMFVKPVVRSGRWRLGFVGRAGGRALV